MITRKHEVILSNGRSLLVLEDPDDKSVSLALGDTFDPTEPEAHLCKISRDGVLVFPHSGDSAEIISERLTHLS